MNVQSRKLWLADLTYTQQTIASDAVPAAIGYLGSYVSQIQENLQVKLFKYPDDLSNAFENDHPTVMGLSNYVWNANLSYAYAKAIKKHYPETIVIMGGPNFPTDLTELEETLREHPEVDFVLTKEGEEALNQLLSALDSIDYSLARKDELPEQLPNLFFIKNDSSFYVSTKLERVLDLTLLPSPYLSGELDEFLDGRLLPVVQTNRGCPFTCTFCTEGQGYWNKVKRKDEDFIFKEISYIAKALAKLPKEKRRTDLLIADSNFGMYPKDLDVCKGIRQVQEKYGYPEYINVATGKNKKERILEAARLVNGAMKLAGSVQSLDPEVQKNIKRSNISASEIMQMAIDSAEIGTNTYSEVILALPGDNINAHFTTLKTLIEANFNVVCMYQLMVLPGTELGSIETKKKHGMKGRFRVIPRSFGYFNFKGEWLTPVEIEEIIVETDTLPYKDYLQCRRMNFIVNLFYNDGVFSEILHLIRLLKLSIWDWLEIIYSEDWGLTLFDELLRKFTDETENELWEDPVDLWNFAQNKSVIQKYIDGELGSNLIFKYKALSLTQYYKTICEVAEKSIEAFFISENVSPEMIKFAKEIIQFNYLRVSDIFIANNNIKRGYFQYDVSKISQLKKASELKGCEYKEKQGVEFFHDDEQKSTIEGYINLFGNNTTGLTRILSRVYLKNLFRESRPISAAEVVD